MAAVSSSFLHLFFFLLIIFVDGQCLDDQKKLLLDLKSELIFNSSESYYLAMWNETDDACCQWGGVRCDGGGRVVGLELEDESITGRMGESSSLFLFTHLSELDLSYNDLSTTQILSYIHRLTNLRKLFLLKGSLMGPIPSSLSNLTHLVELGLSFNSFTGSIPSSLSNLTHLVKLDLSFNSLTGSIPSTLSNLTHLLHLDLSYNSFTGSIPSFHMCNSLGTVSLVSNNLTGSLSGLDFEALTNLSFLDLNDNSLSGTIPHHLFTLHSIELLGLSNNQFSGRIKEFSIVNVSKLNWLELSSNRIHGPIPNSFFQLQNLSTLKLSDNLFNGNFKLQNIQSLPSLQHLDLSFNNLSVETTNMNSSSGGFPQLQILYLSSCNMYDFPDLRNQSTLWELDLSNNRIGGDIPSWIWGIELLELNLSLNLLTDLQMPFHIPVSLRALDLHSNQLRSGFHLFIQPAKFYRNPIIFLLANNSLTGVIPKSICNSSQFSVLDLSFNNLSGSIPPCLLEKNHMLGVLNLRGNKIDGAIPDKFSLRCDLKSFDVSDNNLGGQIPKSLSNCKVLKVMNVGNNKFNDSFPCMLPLSLHVLVLRFNRFYGDLGCRRSWPNLQILDISSNNFSGTLNHLNLSTWRGMMLENPLHIRPNRSNFVFLSAVNVYQDEVTITVKGIEVRLVKIWPDFTSIDLSCNNFEGEIPDAIGSLTSLYLLNLSHNALTSTIPKSLSALTGLGSLDLSANQLTGRIPEELAKLTFLSILNVSYNYLTGMIPTGFQFQTFSTDSFEGNPGLCGLPLNKSCSSPPHDGSGVPSSKSKDEEIEWEYVIAALGYAVGLGTIAWTLLCCRSLRERYFEKIEEAVDKIFYEPGRRRRHARRVQMRNEVIRRRRQRAS